MQLWAVSSAPAVGMWATLALSKLCGTQSGMSDSLRGAFFAGPAPRCRLKTPEGRKVYAARTDPGTGVWHHQIGDWIPSIRCAGSPRGEWSLVTMAWNIKRMFVLTPA